MDKCKNCAWLYDEPAAGLIDHCGNENLTEEERDKHRNRKEGECPGFIEREEQ